MLGPSKRAQDLLHRFPLKWIDGNALPSRAPPPSVHTTTYTIKLSSLTGETSDHEIKLTFFVQYFC